MKKENFQSRFLILLLGFLTLSVTQVWGAAAVYKTAKFGSAATSGSSNGYTSTFESNTNGFIVNVANGNTSGTQWALVKFGRKNTASVGSITTKSAVDKAVTKIDIKIDAVTATKINSVTLYSGSSASTITTTEGTYTIATGTQSVSITSPAANKFYKIEFDCASGSSNGLISISKVEYYVAGEKIVVTLDPNYEGAATPYETVEAEKDSDMPDAAAKMPSRDGFTLLGFFEKNDGTGKQYYNADGSSANKWDKSEATTIYANWQSASSPTVAINGTGLADFTYIEGKGPSTPQTVSVSGSNLEGNITVTAPDNYEVCTTQDGTYSGSVALTPSEKTIEATTIYVRLKADLAKSASYNGNLTASSTNATTASVALKGSVTEAPLSTMDAIFAKAKAVKSTETVCEIKFGNWVISGVSGNQAFLTDGTKGLIIYQSSHGFSVGDILSGTASCKVLLFAGSAELKEITSSTEGLTVTSGGSVSPQLVTIADLDSINTGALVTVQNLTFNGSTLSDGSNTATPYTSLYSGAITDMTSGKAYNYTGVYQQYYTTKRIMARSAADIVEVIVPPTFTTQPQGANYAQGDAATAMTVATSGSTATYQWYSNTTESTEGASEISGATAKSYTPSTADYGTTYYFCIASNTAGKDTSDIAAIKVAQKYDITITSSAYATLSSDPSGKAVEGATVTLTYSNVAEHYHFVSWDVTGATPSSTTENNVTFTMPSNAVSVAANIEADSKRNVTLHIGSETSTVTDVYDGTLFSAIKPATDPLGSAAGDCADSFVGWATKSISGTTDKDGYDAIKVTAETAVSETQKDFYAVFATGQGGVESKAVTLSNGVYSGSGTTGKITWTESGVVSILQEKGNSSTSVNSSYVSAPRWYSSHVITITPSKALTKIDVTTADAGYATKLAGSTYTNATAEVDKTTSTLVHITPTNGSQVITITMGDQSRPTAITVYYDNKTYSNYVTTCCQKYNITLTDDGTKTGGTFAASPASACAGTEITLTANPATGYEFKSWTTTPEQTITDNKFEMPAEAVTVDATFVLQKHNVTLHYNNNEDPEVTDVTEFTYGTPQNLKTLEALKWSAPASHNFGGWATTASGTGVYEDGYSYTLTAEQDVDLYATWVEESLRSITYTPVDHLTYGTNPETISKDAQGFVVAYAVDAHYQVTSATVTVNGVTLTEGVTVGQNGLTVEKNGFEGPVVVTPTVAAITYNVIWSANGSQVATNTVQQGSKPTLPDSEPTTCGTGIVFMGWTDNTIDDQATPPTVLFKDAATAPAVETATENTVTFYAVYAEQSGSGEMVDVELARAEYDTWTISGTTSDKGTYRLMGENSYAETTTTFDLGKITKVVVYGGTYGGSGNCNITISDGTTTWKKTAVSGSSATGVNTYTVETNPLSGIGKVRVASRSGNGSDNGVRLSKFIAYTQAQDYTYSHYSTTCVPPLVAPTITTEAGSYCGSVNVEITKGENPDGAKIYYTTDATAEPVVWTEYPDGGITIETLGATTITAKVDYLTKSSETVANEYTVLKQYSDLSTAFSDATDDAQTACFTFSNLLVNAKTISTAYLTDGSNTYLIYKSGHTFAEGDKLSANDAKLSFKKYNGRLQFTSVEGITVASQGNETTPTAKAITDVTTANYGELITLSNVVYNATDGTFSDGTNTIKYSNSIVYSMTIVDGAQYNVTGIVVLTGDDPVVPAIAARGTKDLVSTATKLDPPTNMAATAKASSTADLTWTKVTDATKYTIKIYEGTEEVKSFNTTDGDKESYSPTGLKAGTTYTWTIQAIGNALTTSNSDVVNGPEFTTFPAAKLVFKNGAEEFDVTYAVNDKVVLPAGTPVAACSENYQEFICWVNAPIEGIQPTKITADQKVDATTSALATESPVTYTYYAAFGKVDVPAVDKYIKVTAAPKDKSDNEDWTGEYLFVFGDNKAFDGSLTTLDATGNTQDVTVSENVITGSSTIAGYRFIVTKSATEPDAWGTYYNIQSASGYYMGGTTDNNNGIKTSTTEKIDNQFEYDGGVAVWSNNKYLTFNDDSGQKRFRYMKSDNENITMYKRDYVAAKYAGYITTCPTMYTITETSKDEGSVTAAKTTNIEKDEKVLLTATANDGYKTAAALADGAWKITKTGVTPEVDVTSEVFSMYSKKITMPEYNVTIDYNFVAKEDHFVDYLRGNVEQTASGAGTGYEIPSLENATVASGCDAYYKFVGWSATEINSGEPAEAEPTLYAGTYATDATYYAVWKSDDNKYITTCCTTPVPTNLHVVAGDLKATSAKLDWNNVTGATKYRVYVTDGDAEINEEVTNSEVSLSGLTPSTTYYAVVKAYAGCWGVETDDLEFTTKSNVEKYTVTINVEHGTYTIDPALADGKIEEGQTVTISSLVADANYYLKDVTVPQATDLTEVDGSYLFTMPGKATTININFVAYPSISWVLEGVEVANTMAVPTATPGEFKVGKMQSAPASWPFKEEFYKDFAGWLVGTDVDNPEFATVSTIVPADGLTLNAAVAKTARVDFDNLVQVTTTIDENAKYVIGATKGGSGSDASVMYYFNGIADSNWGRMVTEDATTDKAQLVTITGNVSSFSIKTLSGQYIASSTKNFVLSDDPSYFSLSSNAIVRSGSTTYAMRHNYNSGNGGLRWYSTPTSTGTPTYLYKATMKYEHLTITPSATTTIRTGLSNGTISGICYEQDIVAHTGASFYYLSKKASDYIELTEVTGVLYAGYPYLFMASDSEIKVIFDGEAESEANNYNGLYGTFVDKPLGDGYCIILNNKYYRTHDDNNNGCYNHRAYIKLDEVEEVDVAPGEDTPAPSPRRIRLGANEVNTPTGFNFVEMDEENIQKVIFNNQLMIIRGGKMYNATGAVVK